MSKAKQAAERARVAASALVNASTQLKNEALYAMAHALRTQSAALCQANELDCQAAREKGISPALLDRLFLDDGRIEDMARALESLVQLDDPTHRVLEERVLYNGIRLQKVSVPLGVVAMVYEARPNVTADAAGICIKSGNACVLRCGSLALKSAVELGRVMRAALEEVGLPADCIMVIDSPDRSITDELLVLRGLVDVLIPRGGEGLIQHCVQNALIPVIETGTGNCHVYVHESADLDMAREIILNAKCRRFGVCNAAETLLVDRSIARTFLPETFLRLAEKEVLLHCDEEALACASWEEDTAGRAGVPLRYEPATEHDWATEYLAPELAVKCVDSPTEAIEHINRYGTRHSEAIVANPASESGKQAIEAFTNQVDAAALYVNASTAFTDGGEFGLGAEIGISTQKLHVRGPFALEALTTYKYLLQGEGQVRS